MKRILIAVLAGALASPALAQPAPAGKCSLVDGGVAVGKPLRKTDQGLEPLSTPAPESIGNAVADVAFHVGDDGTVSDVTLLCNTGSDAAGKIVDTVKTWRFKVIDKKNVPSKVTYRVSNSGVMPLNIGPRAGGATPI